MQRTGVIIVAGGSGQRCGGALPKQFRLLGGKPVLARTIGLFAEALPDAPIVVVLPADRIAFWRDLSARFDIPAHTLVEGGDERFHSVRNGLAALPDDVELVAVHDGVRPLATPELIRRTLDAAAAHAAAIPVLQPVDSFRITDDTDPSSGAELSRISSHPVDRRRLRIVQTPQAFRSEVLRKGYEAPYDSAFTDDASVVERAGYWVFLAEGECTNLKITTEEDFTLAEAILSARDRNDADDL